MTIGEDVIEGLQEAITIGKVRAENLRLRAALTNLYIDGAQTAVNGLTTVVDSGRHVFNDDIWRENDPVDFALFKLSRDLLGLNPFEFDGRGWPDFDAVRRALEPAPPIEAEK